MFDSEKEEIKEVLQRIEKIPRDNLTPETFMAALLTIEPVTRAYISRPVAKGAIEFGIVIVLPPRENGATKRFIPESITADFSYS